MEQVRNLINQNYLNKIKGVCRNNKFSITMTYQKSGSMKHEGKKRVRYESFLFIEADKNMEICQHGNGKNGNFALISIDFVKKAGNKFKLKDK